MRSVRSNVVPDHPVYQIREIITLTITGDADGASDVNVFGKLAYDAALTDTLSTTQTPHTSFNGAHEWTQGVLRIWDGGATFMNQIGGLSPLPVDQLQIATVTLRARRVGVVDVAFSDLHFFGLDESSPTVLGTSFSIGTNLGYGPLPVPEPTTGVLLSLGLVGLALRRRQLP